MCRRDRTVIDLPSSMTVELIGKLVSLNVSGKYSSEACTVVFDFWVTPMSSILPPEIALSYHGVPGPQGMLAL